MNTYLHHYHKIHPHPPFVGNCPTMVPRHHPFSAHHLQDIYWQGQPTTPHCLLGSLAWNMGLVTFCLPMSRQQGTMQQEWFETPQGLWGSITGNTPPMIARFGSPPRQVTSSQTSTSTTSPRCFILTPTSTYTQGRQGTSHGCQYPQCSGAPKSSTFWRHLLTSKQ